MIGEYYVVIMIQYGVHKLWQTCFPSFSPEDMQWFYIHSQTPSNKAFFVIDMARFRVYVSCHMICYCPMQYLISYSAVLSYYMADPN